MTALATLILPALLPAFADGFKGLFQKFFGGSKPIAVDDQIKMMTAETEKLRVISTLDTPVGTPSQWVVDLRASFRYVAAAVIILGTVLLVTLYFWLVYFKPAFAEVTGMLALIEMFAQMSASVFSFMFGDRVYLGLKTATGK